jgi:glyoxylase-like metal-dependent hydrolase (beta-lactamase superfamily II)
MLAGMTTNTIRVGNVTLTRVGYADVGVDPARVGLSREQVAAIPWAEPLWADGDDVRAGAAAWVIDSGDARIVVDPAFAADPILRNDHDAAAHQTAFAALLESAGFARETFTHAIATHYEGVGMLAWRNDDGSWERFFSSAPILMSQAELDAMDAGDIMSEAVMPQLRAQGALQAVTGAGMSVTEDVSVAHTGGHSPGHQIVRVSSQGEHAVIVGHLAVSALHLATGECPQEHMDPKVANAALEKLLAEDTVLIGPLWPAPGAGRWDGERLIPVG